MQQFVTEASHYVAERRQARYDYSVETAPLLGGAVDMALTLRLNATGRLGHFAFHAGRVVRDEPLDRLVLAGLDELDNAASALGLARTVRYDARWLAGALEEVRDTDFVSLTREQHFATADLIERSRTSIRRDRDLARLAAAVLLHRGFEHHLSGRDTVPRAWFIDLETLFEHAVRDTLRALLHPYDVDLGAAYGRRLFVGGADTTVTKPDIVIHTASSVVAIGDVKYKTLRNRRNQDFPEADDENLKGNRALRPDIYQLLAHAASVSAEVAFLVYVGDDDNYASSFLGKSANTRVATWVAKVRPKQLAEDLDRFIGEVGIAPEGLRRGNEVRSPTMNA